MILEKEFFEYVTDDQGRTHLALRVKVPHHLLQAMGLLTDASDEESALLITQIPLKSIRDIQERCVFTAEFATVEENPEFNPPVQLVTIPCRSAIGHGRCKRTGEDRPCTLFGVMSSVQTGDKDPVHLIVAPKPPGTELLPSEETWLLQKRDTYEHSLRQWDDLLTPVHLVLDATTRGVQFWLRSWLGK
ncbi:MAG: hypothetical protein G8237_00965 [Magnetococcales bacterium]|nr:hypothetical protein [Magnetococcales bacterium]